MVVTKTRMLDWDSSYEIVLELMERFPDIDIDSMSLNDLNERILALPGFVDDPEMVNDNILSEILREWYEEIGE